MGGLQARFAPRVIFASLLAFASGAGGLLFEVVCLRRSALVCGHGSVGQALVFAAFLVGFGLGGLVVPRIAFFGRRPLRGAVLLWAVVALLVVGVDYVLAGLRASAPLAPLLVFAAALVTALPMGGALPLLFPRFTAGDGRGVGIVQGANLLGSVGAAVLGSGYLVPDFGMRATAFVAAGLYATASLVLATTMRLWLGAHSPSVGRASMALHEVRATLGLAACARIAGAGFAVLGLELWLPRRLVFALGSFLPSLVGPLVGAMLGLALGSFLVDAARRRIAAWPSHVLPAAAAVGVALSLVATEVALPAVSRILLPTFEARLLAASLLPFLLLLPATLPLGMLVPLEVEAAARRAAVLSVPAGLVGQAYFVFSIGGLVAALVLPRAFGLEAALTVLPLLAIVPLAVLAFCAPPSRRAWIVGGVAVAALVAAPLAFVGRPALAGARNFDVATKRVVVEASDAVTTASVVHDRARSDVLLYTDEFAAAGGDRSAYMRALGLLAERFAATEGRRVVICLGTGTTAATCARASRGAPIDIVELSSAVVSVAPRFADHHAAYAELATVHVADGRRFVEVQPPKSLAYLTLEPLLPQAPGSVHLYSVDFYRAVHRALRDDGVIVQWVPTHALDASSFGALVASFCEVFEVERGFLLDESTILVGAKRALVAKELPAASDIDAWLCAALSDEDWSLAEFAPRALADLVAATPLRVEDDRPFLERRAFARGVEVLDWLPQNLERLQVPSEATGALDLARHARLAARIALARAVLDPAQLEVARARMSDARRLFPASLLFEREAARIEAALADRAALAALASGSFGTADLAFERAALLAGSDELREAGRAVVALAKGRLDEARERIVRLRRQGIDVRAAPRIVARRERGFAKLFEDPRLEAAHGAPLLASGDAALPDAAHFVEAMARGEAWAEDFAAHRPIEARFRVATEDAPLEVVARFARQLETPLLERLGTWVAKDPRRRLELLARLVPRGRERPRWWREHEAALARWLEAGTVASAQAAWGELVQRFGLSGDEAQEPVTETGRSARAAVLEARYIGPR
mgnify:CR=1 FL=1